VKQTLVDPALRLPRPEWVQRINDEGRMWQAIGVLRQMVPLDADSLLEAARTSTGLVDFGGDAWREPFEVLVRSLDEEAELNLMGRLCSRSELLNLLQTRLKITALLRRHPEIEREPVAQPIFITGLPRSGTSILQELLWQDPRLRTPLFWETYFPVEAALAEGSEREVAIANGGALATQWIRVTPEIQAQHETAGHLPAEDATVWNYSFVSDAIMSFYQNPSYHAYVNAADPAIVYAHHRRLLQVLQWRQPGRRWFGKTLFHLGNLPALFRAYPDARVVVTHRDPLRSMASVTNLLRTFYWQRSDRDFDAPGFEEITLGEPTARRLEDAMELRDRGLVPHAQIVDSRYQDLMEDPPAAVERIYRAVGLDFDADAAERIRHYLAFKPKHKHGVHRYRTFGAEETARLRPLFRRYQDRYGVPDED
jgi:hypothetical protein